MPADDMINAHLTWCEQAGRSQRTITERRILLRRMDGDLAFGLDAVNAEELRAWLYRPQWSAKTRSTYRAHIVSFFAWATDDDDPWLDHDPARRLPSVPAPRGLPRPVTADELRRALAQPAPWCRYALLAAYAGLRCMDIAALDRADISEEAIYIRRGKGGKAAVLPTHPLVWQWLSPLPSGPIMPPGPYDRAKQLSAQAAVRLHAIGIEGGLHRLRHWYGSEIYRRTHDLRVTQELMRHSRPETTAVYTLISDEDRRAAIETLTAA